MNKQKSSVWKVVDNLLDFGPIVLTVIAATISALRAAQTGISIEELLQLVLIVLAFISTTQLIDRIRLLRNLDNKVDSILHASEAAIGLDKVFLSRLPSLEERLRQAKTITHNGLTLVGTSNALLGTFSYCLAQGCRICLLMIDPKDKALVVASQRFYKHQDHQRLKREAEHALDNFSSLHGLTYPGFQISFMNAVPPYSIWLIDANTPKAEIWVGLYSYRDSLEPWLHLLPHRDGEMFVFFQRQIEAMWEHGIQWQEKVD